MNERMEQAISRRDEATTDQPPPSLRGNDMRMKAALRHWNWPLFLAMHFAILLPSPGWSKPVIFQPSWPQCVFWNYGASFTIIWGDPDLANVPSGILLGYQIDITALAGGTGPSLHTEDVEILYNGVPTFARTLQETHVLGQSHVVNIRRIYPTESEVSDNRHWIQGGPRSPTAPTVTGPADGAHSTIDLLTSASQGLASCQFTYQVARDPGFTDLVVNETTPTPETQGNLISPTLGRRFFWRHCGIGPTGERACSAPREWWYDYGEECPDIGVGTGLGPNDVTISHLDHCRAPERGGGYFLEDHSRRYVTRATGRHNHDGTQSIAYANVTKHFEYEPSPENPHQSFTSPDGSFFSGDAVERDGVSAHALSGRVKPIPS